MAQERRAGWKKFGEAATERAADSVTSQTPDEVQLERIQRQKQTQEEKAKVRGLVGWELGRFFGWLALLPACIVVLLHFQDQLLLVV